MTHLKSHHSHVLLTLGALFVIGAASRFMPANVAVAEETSAGVEAEDDGADNSQLNDPAGALSSNLSSTEACFSPALAQQLSSDRDLLEQETTDLNEEKLSLQAWEAELAARTDELEALQTSLQQRWDEMQAIAGEDIQHLVSMYAAMKADNAAEIFDQMDPQFAAGFLRGMNSEQAGLILANMDSAKAYAVSITLAALNDDVRP